MRFTLCLQCPKATEVWLLLGLNIPTSIDLVWEIITPGSLNFNIWPTVALAILWNIWDARNARVFRNEHLSITYIFRNTISDFSLWIFGFSKEAAMSCRLYLSSSCVN